MLREQCGGFGAITLGAFDRVFKRLLSCFDRGKEWLERELGENDAQQDEDDQRPEHQSGFGLEQIHRAGVFLLGGKRRSSGQRDGSAECCDAEQRGAKTRDEDEHEWMRWRESGGAPGRTLHSHNWNPLRT